MKVFIKTAIAISVIGLCLVGCSSSKVPAGYEGVIVNQFGSSKGVSEHPVSVGYYWLSWNEKLFLFPTFLQNYTWTQSKDEGSDHDESITMQTSEGLSINADVGITYQIQPQNVVTVFQKYRLGIDEITNTFLRNIVRDAMNAVSSSMTVEDLYGSGKEQFLKQVNKIVRDQSKLDGIDVDKIYLIGSMRLPETVVDSINSKIQASQNAMKVENEVATSKAEAQKTIIQAQAQAQTVLINAQAQAQANKILTASISPEFVQYQSVIKWNGVLPGVTGGAVPFVSIPNVR